MPSDRKPTARERAEEFVRQWSGQVYRIELRSFVDDFERTILAAEAAAREDALRDPSEEEVEETAQKLWENEGCPGNPAAYAKEARAALTAFLEGRRRG